MAEILIDAGDTVRITEGAFMGRIGRVSSIYQPQRAPDDEGEAPAPEQLLYVKIDGLAQAVPVRKSFATLLKSASE